MESALVTRVVNLHHRPYDVYIGRAGHGLDGYFGNPIRIGSRCQVCGDSHGREQTIACYHQYFIERIQRDAQFRTRVHGLRGKTLGCFCKPRPCHGDVIAEYLNTLESAHD